VEYQLGLFLDVCRKDPSLELRLETPQKVDIWSHTFQMNRRSEGDGGASAGAQRVEVDLPRGKDRLEESSRMFVRVLFDLIEDSELMSLMVDVQSCWGEDSSCKNSSLISFSKKSVSFVCDDENQRNSPRQKMSSRRRRRSASHSSGDDSLDDDKDHQSSKDDEPTSHKLGNWSYFISERLCFGGGGVVKYLKSCMM
jgi:hypothetical protein